MGKFCLILNYLRDANFLAKTQLYIRQKRNDNHRSGFMDSSRSLIQMASFRICTNHCCLKTGWRDFQTRSDDHPCASAHGSVEVLGVTAMEKCLSAFLPPSIPLLARAMIPPRLAIGTIAQEGIDTSGHNSGHQIILRADK